MTKSSEGKIPLEFYDLEGIYNEYLPSVIRKIIHENIVFPPIKYIDVEGTTYMEYVDGKLHKFDLEEHTNEMLVSNTDIASCDFISFRSEIIQKSVEMGYEQIRQIIKVIEDNSTTLDLKDEGDVLDKYFRILR